MQRFKAVFFLLWVCLFGLLGLTLPVQAETLITCSGSTKCTISVFNSAAPTQYTYHTIELVVPKDSSGNPVEIPDNNKVTFKYDGQSYQITCDGNPHNLGSSPYSELQNKISCTVAESRTGVNVNLTIFDRNVCSSSSTGGSSPTYTTGKVGSALKFDGIDDYTSFTPPRLTGNASFTVEFWMKYEPQPKRQWILDFGKERAPCKDIHFLINPNGITQFGLWGGSTCHYSGQQNQFDISPYQNTWVFVATTYDAGTGELKTYLNGKLVDSDSVQKDIPMDLGPGVAQIGEKMWNESYFKGSIDELRILSVPLSQNQIKEDYNASSSGQFYPDRMDTLTWLHFDNSQNCPSGYNYLSIYDQCPGYTIDTTLRDTDENNPYCVSDDSIAQTSACKWEKQNTNDSLLNQRGVPLNDWVVYAKTTVNGLKLGYELSPPPPPGISESDYVCVDDFNGNGQIDEGEIEKCQKIGSNYFCPLGAAQCNENHICPLGNYPCNNGSCTKTGSCSSSQVSYTDYQCPVDGRIYSSLTTCNNNCIRVGSCSERTIIGGYGTSQVCWGNFYHMCAKITVSGQSIKASVDCDGWADGNWISLTGSGISTAHSSLVHDGDFSDNVELGIQTSNGNIRICNGEGYGCGAWVSLTGSGTSRTDYCSGEEYDEDWASWFCDGTEHIRLEVSNGFIRYCNDHGCGSWIKIVNTAYTCSLNGHSYSSYSSCQNNCRQVVTCVTHTDYTTKWLCSLNGQQYDTHSQCTSSCYQTAACSTNYTCPLGNYPCLNVSGTYECSPNQCEQYGSGATNEDTQEGANDKQNDGQVDQKTGKCLGTIYIFNGHDRRCRTPGVQTGWTNCCHGGSDWLGLSKCNAKENQLAKLKDKGLCHYVGEYCASKFAGICLQHKKTYCCFNSKLGRIIAEQGRPQLKSFGPDGGWGDPKHPNCRGFTPEEFQELDFSKIDLSEFYQDIQKKAADMNKNLQNNINNAVQQIQNYYK